MNITINTIKNGLINLIKIENHVQQFEGDQVWLIADRLSIYAN